MRPNKVETCHIDYHLSFYHYHLFLLSSLQNIKIKGDKKRNFQVTDQLQRVTCETKKATCDLKRISWNHKRTNLHWKPQEKKLGRRREERKNT